MVPVDGRSYPPRLEEFFDVMKILSNMHPVLVYCIRYALAIQIRNVQLVQLSHALLSTYYRGKYWSKKRIMAPLVPYLETILVPHIRKLITTPIH